MPVTFTESNFENEVLKCDMVVLVDFGATWCPHCKRLSPTIDSLFNEFDGRAKIGNVDVDMFKNLTTEYHIEGYPTVLIFKNGKEIERFIGTQQKSVYADALNRLI